MITMSRAEVLRKCLIVFDALRRENSKGNAGLEPERGAEKEYSTVDECIRIMKEWMQEMEAGLPTNRTVEPKVTLLKEWQRIAAQKPPERLDFDEDTLE